MGKNDNAYLLETATTQNIHAHIYSNYSVLEGSLSWDPEVLNVSVSDSVIIF